MSSRLASEQSAYLRSAAEQPVDWYPWSRKAFERAVAESKPILLDIGAVWCHWCHVMDHESYEDPAVAQLLNRDWICIKVDRDERPDVDARYQRAVQALSGQGGWPLTAFLTPNGDVFYGGTYFPPDTRQGRPGLRTVLAELAQRYRETPDEIHTQAGELANHLRTYRTDLQRGALDPALLDLAADSMARAFDFRNGGFGTQPKFPHGGACQFLLGYYQDTGHAWAAEIVSRTLVGMAHGGIYDHLGGGFHRYSVDARWIVPHFEKMLYDNAELLGVYARAAALDLPGADRSLLRDVVNGIVRWTMEVMADPMGGYAGSQDADVAPGDDGDYFTWTTDEVAEVLRDDVYEVVTRYFGIGASGQMHHNPRKNVLHVQQSPSALATILRRDESEIRALLAAGCTALLAHRGNRPTPFVDRTLYTAWNSMMISALLDAAALLERDDIERHALASLERFFAEAAAPDLGGGMRHAVGGGVMGILDDQVHAANAALDAFETTGDPGWLERATRLMTQVLGDYGATAGGLRDALRGPEDGAMLADEIVPIQDSPTPSPNAVAAIVLSRLWALTEEPEWRDARDALLEPMAGNVPGLAVFGATLTRALDWATRAHTVIAIVGEAEATRRLRWAARRGRPPRSVIQYLASDNAAERLPASIRGMLAGTTPAAYVCTGMRCAPPAHTVQALMDTFASFTHED
jgi:uncharacterized protein YyaL (SSP411 family)